MHSFEYSQEIFLKFNLFIDFIFYFRTGNVAAVGESDLKIQPALQAVDQDNEAGKSALFHRLVLFH
jgi:hypothetical protein